MTMAERIQMLRKTKGISQEELADQMGVSRQAVSKWESEQSSPDLEKVILLSDYFEVTTDYLLKGTEPKFTGSQSGLHEKNVQDARIYAAAATALNFVGLVTAIMIWTEEQTPGSVAVGFIFFAVGCMVYVLGQIMGENKVPAKKWFLVINVWILFLIPISCIFNLAAGMKGGYGWIFSPVPRLELLGSFKLFGLSWLCYIGCCTAADMIVIRKSRRKE